MRTKIILAILAVTSGVFFFSSCKEDRDYPLGVPELAHHYYIAFIPYNNSVVTVNKNQTALVKFPVQFHSSFTRSYDAVANYKVVAPATNAAVQGVDFDIVDKNGTVLSPVDGKYSITFEKAERRKDTIYVKLLNNPAPGVRNTEIQLMDNLTPEYEVDTMSTAFKRPLKIQ
ncbi:MAG TPA: hypothetical protein VL125_02895 [Pelobium sp.]|jgi:hypothetical protein|nr:hypothetical protein [Pelobium sp.]